MRSRLGAVERDELLALVRRRREHAGRRRRRPRPRPRARSRGRRPRRRRPSPGRACGTSRRAGRRARASAGGRPRPRSSSWRGGRRSASSSAREVVERGGDERLDRGRRARASGTRLGRAARQVHDAEAGLDLDDARLARVVGAGEHVALDAGAGERATRARARTRSSRRRRPYPGCASGDVCTLSIATRRTDMARRAYLRAQGPLTVGRGSVRPSDRSDHRPGRPVLLDRHETDRLVEGARRLSPLTLRLSAACPEQCSAATRSSSSRRPIPSWRRDTTTGDRQFRDILGDEAVAVARLGVGPVPRRAERSILFGDEPVVAVPRPSGEVRRVARIGEHLVGSRCRLVGTPDCGLAQHRRQKGEVLGPGRATPNVLQRHCLTVSRPRCGPPRPVAAGTCGRCRPSSACGAR